MLREFGYDSAKVLRSNAASFVPEVEGSLPAATVIRCVAEMTSGIERVVGLLEQLAHEPKCRVLVAPGLDENVEDVAVLVDGARL